MSQYYGYAQDVIAKNPQTFGAPCDVTDNMKFNIKNSNLVSNTNPSVSYPILDYQ